MKMKKNIDLKNEDDIEEKLKTIEYALRHTRDLMRALYPNFNSVPNAERFMQGTFAANKALRGLQDGDEGEW